jgi:hypothetical protein
MPRRSSRSPQALHPCSRARGVALPVLATGKSSRWVRADNLFELDLLTTAALENRSSTGCPYVVDPLHVISEH